MRISLVYNRHRKPRGGYAYPLEFRLHCEGMRRNWEFEWHMSLGPIWLSNCNCLKWQSLPRAGKEGVSVTQADGDVILRVDWLTVATRCQTRSVCRVPLMWYTRTAEERERLIEALHQAVEAARQDWIQFWRATPPLPGDRYPTRVSIPLPDPEEIYFSHKGRQYWWEDTT
jgi:hypothetical protein